MDCRNVSLSELSGIAWLSRLQQMGRHGQWQTILESLQQLPNDVAPEVAYSMAIISCGRCLQWQFSFELVKALQARKKEEAATYSAMAPVFIPNIVVVGSTLSVLSKASKWQQANAILPWLRQTRVQANAMAYNSAMTSFTSASRWQVATCLLSRGNVDTVQADVVSYTLLINNYEQTTQWQSGMALLQQLCCCIQPDGIVYNAAINACSKGAQWRTSETLLRELSRAELQMETVSFNTLASACEKAQQWKDAALTMTSLGSLSIEADVFSFSVALKASRNTSSRGKWQVCWTLLDKIQRDQVQPDDVLQNVALIETAEQWQFALMFLSTLQDQADILAYNSALSTSGRATCWTGAQEILRTMKVQDIQPGVVSCTSLIRACTFGNWQFAEKVLGEFRFRGLQEDVVACTAAIKACDSVGEWRRVLWLFANFQSRKLQADIIAYNDIISACTKGAWQQSQQVLLALRILGLPIRTVALNAVLPAVSEWQKVQEYLAQQHKQSVQSDLVTLNAASTVFDRLGEQLPARFLGSVEAACQSEFELEKDEKRREWCRVMWVMQADTILSNMELPAMD